MASEYLALASGGISLASSVFGSSGRRREARRRRRAKEKQIGINAAGIDFSLARQESFIPEQLDAINTNTLLAEVTVSRQQAVSEAELRVSAAAAGVTGSSVDVAIMDTEMTKETNLAILDRKKQDQIDQVKVNLVDSAINAEISKETFIDNDRSSVSTDNALAGLDFLSAYLSKL